jgi:hypothetical protein
MFFDSEEQKILLGNSIPMPEADLDDSSTESDLGFPVEESALMQYYFESITNHIGKPDFKSEYLTVKSQILTNYDFKDQRVLAEVILRKVEEEMGYIPSPTFDIYSFEAIDDVYKFIEFLEYDHEEFISTTWKFLNPDIDKLDIDNYCKTNSDKIMREIEEQIDANDYTWLIANFLRTNNKEDLIEWFCNKSKNLITLIKIRILEGVSNV